MDKRSKITTEEKQLIIELGKQGINYTSIARQLNNKVTKQRVKQICDTYNVDSTYIRKKKNQDEYMNRMTAKWGKQWQDDKHRRSFVYQAMRQKFRTKKANAARIGKEWTVEFGDLEFPTHCPILNIELDYFAETAQENSPSFDCVDPSKGYVKGNVVVISWRANRIKNDGSAEEHLLISEFIASYAVASV